LALCHAGSTPAILTKQMKYAASNGEVWNIYPSYPPIPTRLFDWAGVHEDYDGAPDACDNRMVSGETEELVKEAIELFIDDEAG
jgi:hypothetical protein